MDSCCQQQEMAGGRSVPQLARTPLDAHKIGGLHSIRAADHLLLLKVYMHLDRRCKAWLLPKEIPSKSLTLEAPRAPRAGTKPEPFGFFVFWVWLRILAGTHLLS